MKTNLRIICASSPTGKVAKFYFPKEMNKIVSEDRDYLHVMIRHDLGQITVGAVKRSDMAYKLKRDFTITSRPIQDELNLKMGQMIELEMTDLDVDNRRMVFQTDAEKFKSITSRFF